MALSTMEQRLQTVLLCMIFQLDKTSVKEIGLPMQTIMTKTRVSPDSLGRVYKVLDVNHINHDTFWDAAG